MRIQFNLAMLLAVLAASLSADNSNHGFTASLKNCTELIGFGPVSFAAARALVPANYALVPFDGNAGLVVRASRCVAVGATPSGFGLTLGSSRVLEFRREDGPATVRALLPGDLKRKKPPQFSTLHSLESRAVRKEMGTARLFPRSGSVDNTAVPVAETGRQSPFLANWHFCHGPLN